MPAARLTLIAAGTVAMLGTAAAAARYTPPVDEVACRPADRVLGRPSAIPAAVAAAARSGRLLVANQGSDAATIVDLATGATTQLDTGDGPHEAAVSADGRWGIVSNYGERAGEGFDGNRLFVIDMAAARIARVIETGDYRGLHDVAFIPGRPTRALVTAQTSRRVVEVDVVSGEFAGTVPTGGDRSHMLAIGPDGRTVFTTNEGTATISRLDLPRRAFVRTFPATDQVEGIAVAAGGREIWVGEPALGAVTVRDAETGATLATLTGFRYPVRIVPTREGDRVVISDPGCRNIVVADGATRRILTTLRVENDPPALVGDVAPGGRVAFASVSAESAVVAIDLEAGTIVGRHRTGRHPDGLEWGPRPDRSSP